MPALRVLDNHVAFAGSRWLASLAALSIVLAGAACQGRSKLSERFHQGRELVVTGQYRQAIPVLEAVLRDAPSGGFASRASFFIAKAHLGLGELEAAALGFERTLADYPGSLEAQKSPYKLALIQLVSGNLAASKKGFAAIADAPDTPLAPEAQAMASYLARVLELRPGATHASQP